VLRFKAEDLIEMQYSVEIEHIHKVVGKSSGEERKSPEMPPLEEGTSREAIISQSHEKPKRGMQLLRPHLYDRDRKLTVVFEDDRESVASSSRQTDMMLSSRLSNLSPLTSPLASGKLK